MLRGKAMPTEPDNSTITAEPPLPVLSTTTEPPAAMWVIRDVVFLVVYIGLIHVLVQWLDTFTTIPKFWKREVIAPLGCLLRVAGFAVVAGWGRQPRPERALRIKYSTFGFFLIGLPLWVLICLKVVRWDFPHALGTGLGKVIENSMLCVVGFFISLAAAPAPKAKNEENAVKKS